MLVRCSWIPVIADDDSVLLRFSPHWGNVWYWPSVTDDLAFRPMSEFLATLAQELGLDRSRFFEGRAPIEIREFYEEVLHVPSSIPSAYHFRVIDLRHIASLIRRGEFVSPSGQRHRWVPVEEIEEPQTPLISTQPEVPAIWRRIWDQR